MNLRSNSFSLPLHDVVCCLKQKPFSLWNERDQIDLVKFGRQKPTLGVGKRKSDDAGRYHFFRSPWYFRYNWICGSAYLRNIHCWPCLLFAKESDRWECEARLDKTNFRLFEEHVGKETHCVCLNKLAEFRKNMFGKKSLSLSLPLHDVVCCLLEKPFSTWDKEDQIDLVRFGRPKATVWAGKRKSDEEGRYHFFRNAWYVRYDWICGSAYLHNIHCWPCLLFGKESDRWVCDVDLNENEFRLFSLFDEHVGKEEHDVNVQKLAEFRKEMYRRPDDLEAFLVRSFNKQVSSSDDLNPNDVVRLNRQCAKYALDAILFMVKNQMPLLQKDEFSPCSHAELLQLLMSQSSNEEAKNHFRKMKGPVNPILTKPMLQGVIESFSECIQEYIESTVKAAKFFSIRIDDGLHESSDCAVFLRIVNQNDQIKEFYLGSYSLANDKTSLSLFRILDNLLEKYDYKSKLVGICFDITCVKFNYLKDLRVGMKFMAQQSININLLGHSIDYLLEKCLSSISTCHQFFNNLTALFKLIKILLKRNYSSNSEKWREVCKMENSCCSKFTLLSAMLPDWIGMIQFFKEIQQDVIDLEDVPCLVSSIFERLQDYHFIFLVVYFHHVFQITSTLYKELRSHPFDAKYSQERVKDVCLTLYKQRNEIFYAEFYSKAHQIVRDCSTADSSLSFSNIDTCNKSLYFEVIDNIIMELHTRFENTENHIFFELGDLLYYETYKPYRVFIKDRVHIVMNYFPTFFKDSEALENELYQIIHYRGYWKASLVNVLSRLKNTQSTNNSEKFSEAYNLLTLIMLLTPSLQTFPCLHEFSSYLKNSDSDLKQHLASILMNKDVLDTLSNKYSFKDDVLNKLSDKYDAIKLSHMVKSLEKKSEVVIGSEPDSELGLEPKIMITTVTPSDIIAEMDSTTLITPDIDPPDLSVPGPSNRMEPDSSMTEQDVFLALTCETYPAYNPQPILLTKVKEEPIDTDEYKEDILSATVVQELNSVTSSCLLQPPVLIKEEPVSSEEEL